MLDHFSTFKSFDTFFVYECPNLPCTKSQKQRISRVMLVHILNSEHIFDELRPLLFSEWSRKPFLSLLK